MTERQARQQGYSFHGAYDHDKDVIKRRAAELRAQGNKAVVVNVPPNPLSRGYHGMGYSVYWIESEANIEKRNAEDSQNKRNNLRNLIVAKISELEAIIQRGKECNVLVLDNVSAALEMEKVRLTASLES